MKQEAFIESAKQFIKIPSTEHDLAAIEEACTFITSRIEASGKDITIERFERNGRPSLLAYLGTERPDRFRVIFNGHLDVVPGKPAQYEPYIKDNRLYGRGTYDMKVAALVMTDVFCEYVDKVPYAFGLQLVCDEELSGQDGTKYQIECGVRADFIVCGECGRLPGEYEIANEAKGVVHATVEFTGSSSHGAYPWRGGNAAMKAAHFATRIHERYPTPTEATGDTTVTITSIVSNSDAHNKTSDHAIATIDARYAAGDPSFQTAENFSSLLREFDPDVQIKGYGIFSGPMFTNPENPFLLALKAAAERAEGHTFTYTKRNGTNDGRFYSEVGGQACEFGIPGENQHGDDEYVTVDAIKAYHAALRDFIANSITIEEDRNASIS